MTPQQDSLSGVIICPAKVDGTAVKGELLHHRIYYNPPRASMSMRLRAAGLPAQIRVGA